MKVFPKNVTEEIWIRHLRNHSTTLHGHEDKLREILPNLLQDNPSQNTYLCPLCLKNYFINTPDGIQGNSEFSLDHLPPESTGGKYKVLTCKKCNNDSGVFEAELERVVNFAIDKVNLDAFHIRKVKVNDSQTGNYIKGEIRHMNDKTDILFNEKAKKHDPNHISFLHRIHSTKNVKLELEIPLYNKAKIEKALLKSAYLICFLWWGYEFVFSKNAFLIREVLNDRMKYPVQVPLSWQNGAKGLSLVSIDNERIAFMVGIELIGIDVKTIVNILIPNPTNLGLQALEQINKKIKQNSEFKMSCVTIPRIPHSMAYTISWNIVLPISGN